MPELESMTITVEEAKRRKAVADMIIAEIAVSEALAEAASLSDAEEYPFEGVVWHCQYGWLYTASQLQAAVESASSGGVSKAKLARILKIDKEVEQDQIAPDTWTTIPEGFDVDTDPFEITAPEEKIVIASADTQKDGTEIRVVEISINGVIRTVCAPESVLRDFERIWIVCRRCAAPISDVRIRLTKPPPGLTARRRLAL